MNPLTARDRIMIGLGLRRPRKANAIALVLVVASALMLLFLVWPFATLWRIDQAVRGGDMNALDALVDLESVRAQIKKRLNKDADSTIGELSDSFILWLEEGIGIMGNQAVDRLVTLSWVRERLLQHSGRDGAGGFLGRITYAFFDAPHRFSVHIGPPGGNPIRLRLSLDDLRWRVSALYY